MQWIGMGRRHCLRRWSSEVLDEDRLEKEFQAMEREFETEMAELERQVFLCNVGIWTCGTAAVMFLGSAVLALLKEVAAARTSAIIALGLMIAQLVLFFAHKAMAKHWTWIPRAK